MLDEPPPLAIDGGPSVRVAPWPPHRKPIPASDADPASTLEAALAARLALEAESVIACASQQEAARALLGASGVTDGEIVLPALLAERLADAGFEARLGVLPADVDPDAATLSTRGLARALSPATRLVAVVHAFGHPPAMADVGRVASESGALLVEDASDALGAAYQGAPAGALGVAGLFAFGKHRILSADGAPGALLVVRDPEAARRTRSSVNPLDTGIARAALADLRGADDELLWRRRLAWELTFNLRGMKAVSGMPHARWIQHGYARYVVRLRGILWKREIAATVEALRAEGIPCDVACGPPLHLDPRVRTDLDGDERLAEERFPVAARLPRELIAIPIHGDLTSKDMDDVATALRKLEHWST